MNAEFRYGGVEDFVRVTTNAVGQAYIDECRNQHEVPAPVPVPVPEFVIDPTDLKWGLHGDIAQPFIADPMFTDPYAELWSFDPGDGSGFCLAVARRDGEFSNDVKTLGLICQSAPTGRACFFTKDKDDTVISPPGAAGPMRTEDMVSGMDLATAANDEGVCTNCHMGQNAFIVHPDDPAFEGALGHFGVPTFIFSESMTPVVPDHVGWPGNPPPLQALPPTEGGNCSDGQCHGGGAGGRLPIVSTDTADYCANVVRPALGASTVPATMPLAGVPGDFSDHAAWLLGACDLAPGLGQVVPFRPPGPVDPGPPLVKAPYACTRFVRVRSVVPYAVLTLRINGTIEAIETADHTGKHSFELEDELEDGWVLRVNQTVNGQSSEAGKAEVKSHLDEFPDGVLPVPTFQVTPVYKCASSIAAANLPGAEVTVTKFNLAGGSAVVQREVGEDRIWADFIADGDFVVGDQFEVRQRICEAH